MNSSEKTLVTISLGGSILFDESGKIRVAYLRKLREMFERLSPKFSFAITVGGGRVAREYTNAVRELTGSEFQSDRVGIKVTKLNAMVLISALGPVAFPKVIKELDAAEDAIAQGKIPVGAGIIEGLTTDACTLLLAERLNCRLVINASNTNYVYDSDPKKNKNAKKFVEMTHSQLSSLAAQSDDRTAGSHFVFDLIACKLAERSNIELRFTHGSELNELEAAISGKKFEGTTVKD